jgi:V-type H+-transporting ATPase subunit E
MNESEVERQIDQMVRFIKQEAEEKANEIGVSAEEEFNIEKLQLLEAEKAKIRKDYERRESQIEVKKKIETSKQLNESRIKILQAREQAVQQLLDEAQSTLAGISNNKQQYRSLLTDVLVQAFRKLSEPSVLVQARQVDGPLVKEVLDSARAKYKEVFGTDAPQAQLDNNKHLPPPPSGGKSHEDATTCCGGVVVTSANGSIVCSNTLDDRLRIAYSQNLPAVREVLFGKEEPVRS